MADVIPLRVVEAAPDPRVASMCEMLIATLADVRDGEVVAVVIGQIRADGAVMTKWDLDHQIGSSAYLVAALSRLIHELNTVDPAYMDEQEDGA